jgi:hypothetical protein
MGQFIGEHAQAGRFVDGAGLSGSKTRTRLDFSDGKGTVTHGPRPAAFRRIPFASGRAAL